MGSWGDRAFQRDETRRKEAGVQVHMDTTVYATPYIIVTFLVYFKYTSFQYVQRIFKNVFQRSEAPTRLIFIDTNI
jgi:hypothetical protein